MKKKLVLLLCFVTIFTTMTACGSSVKDSEAVVDEQETTPEETKEETSVEESTEDPVSSEVVYSTDDYSITYNTNDFEQYDVRGSIQFSYCNKDVENTAGNTIIITTEEATTVDEIMKAVVEGRGATMDDAIDVTVGPQEIPGKSYVEKTVAQDGSDRPLYDTIILMQKGDNVISIELIRTIDSDEETDMKIEGAFTATFESFVFN